MTAMTASATYWMLDALTGWRTGTTDDVQEGARVTLAAGSDTRYAAKGTWVSGALDGALPGCQWHRIELELDALPAGTSLQLATFTADDDTAAVGLQDDAWSLQPRLVGGVPAPGAASGRSEDLLIQSPPGRYLWIRIDLVSNGHQTPAIRQLVVHYPRNSYLRYLPAVYSANDAGRSFLERFLSVPQTEWDGLRQRIATIARYFDPRAVPEGAPLAYLASWLDAELEPGWTAADQRRFLSLLPSLRGIRGTARGVRDTTRVYLRSIAGPSADAFSYPYLIEGFRERDWLTVAGEAPAAPGRRTGLDARLPSRRLWGADVVRRLQVGGTAQAGYSRLVSVGDPASDMFSVYAHRVRALVPAGWVRTAADQQLLERGLRLELPAHVAAELTLLEPRFLAGLQATLGVDTVAGPTPSMRLASDAAQAGDRVPPSARPPRGHLGYDTVLAAPARCGDAPGDRNTRRKGDEP